jgi:ABC-type polar amino acid transport system ATPase subunit
MASGHGMRVSFQQFNLFPHMTVLENCMLAQRRVKKTPKAEAKDIAMRFLERVRIAEQALNIRRDDSTISAHRSVYVNTGCLE